MAIISDFNPREMKCFQHINILHTKSTQQIFFFNRLSPHSHFSPLIFELKLSIDLGKIGLERRWFFVRSIDGCSFIQTNFLVFVNQTAKSLDNFFEAVFFTFDYVFNRHCFKQSIPRFYRCGRPFMLSLSSTLVTIQLQIVEYNIEII